MKGRLPGLSDPSQHALHSNNRPGTYSQVMRDLCWGWFGSGTEKRHTPYMLFTAAVTSCSTGPVRHFMELVVTGLSKNPFYTAKEKQEYVEWYRKYFSQFTPEELQAIPAARMELDAQQNW